MALPTLTAWLHRIGAQPASLSIAMALQPAAGARDLNPREVEGNRRIRQQLASVYRLWGYQEVDPPSVERLDTLAAGGGIASAELVRLASDDPLGMRPELTASIARAACTRMAALPRPLRLWADGNTFRSSQGEGGHQRIHQQIQSGVELLGEPSPSADAELMRLLLAAAGNLGLQPHHRPMLLVGHHGLLQALLQQLPAGTQDAARSALTAYDPLRLEQLELPAPQRQRLQQLLRLRGEPAAVIEQLRDWLGATPLLQQLAVTLALVEPAASRLGVRLQLDPTFQPHFALYDGLVLKLVCQGGDAPVAIASGGRYDALVGRFSAAAQQGQAAGVGFGFDVEAVRELLHVQPAPEAPVLVAYGDASQLAAAIDQMEQLHGQAIAAELLSSPAASRQEAEAVGARRGCSRTIWLAA
jgi:ATP phosphoribosyltransferase regulatory subunit